MRRMDSEMVLEVPDTPERLSFTRLVGESSSLSRGIDGKLSPSNQYLEPISRNYSQQMKNSGFSDFSGNNAAPVDSDLLFSHSRINQLMPGTHDIRTSESPNCSIDPIDSVRRGFLNSSGTCLEMIDLSQERSLPLSSPTTGRGARCKEEKHLSSYNRRIEINDHDELVFHDFYGDKAVLVDDDFLFSQAKLARFISDTYTTGTMHSHNSVPELVQSSRLDSAAGLEMIDLSQGSPSPLPYPTRRRGPRFKEEKYLSGQIERSENIVFGKHGKRALNPIDGLGKEKNHASNCSKDFDCSNNITEPINRRHHASVTPCHKESVDFQQLNSRTTNELSQTRHHELRFRQGITQQNKLPHDCISSCDLISNTDSQAKADCKELDNADDQRTPSFLARNQGTDIGNGSHKVSLSSTKHVNSNHPDIVLHQKKKGHRMLVRNGCISPSNIAKKKNNTLTKDNEKGGAIASKLPCTNSYQFTHLDAVLHPKCSGTNNGCTSHSNMARNTNDTQARGFEGRDAKIPNGNSSRFLHHSSIGDRTADTGKGKEIMNELSNNSHHIGTAPSLRRFCPIPGKELKITSEMEYDTGRANGHGTTHKYLESSSISSSFATGKCMSENIPTHLSSSRVEMSKGGTRLAQSITDNPEGATLQPGENITQIKGCFRLASEVAQHKGKRKNSFAHSNAGECSSSTATSRIPCDWKSAKPSNSRSIRSRKSKRDTALAPIVEINELTSSTKEENYDLSDESIAKSIQLESDEELARQLQEQFYLESPPVRVDPSLLERPRFHPSTRMIARVRTQVENNIGRTRRHISRPNMSLEERLGFLEALEAAFENADDMDTPDHFLDGQREFDESDYEMLLALDDNNHHVGASQRQINNLPQSLIQNTDCQEACAVCLETPAVGDTIRHLPCLHKFHKDCIDTWLRRKRSCPICKCGIS